MKEEALSQGTCSSQRGVDRFHFSLNSIGSIFRQTQSCKHVFLRANRQYHLNTITNNTHHAGHVQVHNMSRPAFGSLILCCRHVFSLRLRCRHVSNLIFADGAISFYTTVAVGAAATDDGKRSSTVCVCCSLKQTL